MSVDIKRKKKKQDTISFSAANQIQSSAKNSFPMTISLCFLLNEFWMQKMNGETLNKGIGIGWSWLSASLEALLVTCEILALLQYKQFWKLYRYYREPYPQGKLLKALLQLNQFNTGSCSWPTVPSWWGVTNIKKFELLKITQLRKGSWNQGRSNPASFLLALSYWRRKSRSPDSAVKGQ